MEYLQGIDNEDSTGIELPELLKKASLRNYNDILDEGPIPLTMAFKAKSRTETHRGFFVDGQPSQKEMHRETHELLANITEHLASTVKRDLVATRLWLSAGGVVEKYHFEEVHSWMCQFSGHSKVDFVSPQSAEEMYPINFADSTVDLDFQTILTAHGELIDEAIPVEFRDEKLLASAVDEDEPDQFRFPKYVNASHVSCEVKPGSCMWIPSFWWRSVRSEPGTVNMALSFSFGAGLPVNKTKFDVSAARFGYESVARKTQRELKDLDWHTEL
jgi:hypothetical protein